MSQVLSTAARPPGRRGPRIGVRLCVAAARVLARTSPRRLRRILEFARRGAVPARHEQAAAARDDVLAASTRCAGLYCLQRSLATALLCRVRGTWPTWCTGVRTPPFAAHAWVEADGRPVAEPTDTLTYRAVITVPPAPRAGDGHEAAARG